MKAFNAGEFETYKAEAREKWGKTEAYKEHAEKTKCYGKDRWNDLAAELDAMFGDFASCMKSGESPDGDRPQGLVKKLQDHITQNYYTCTDEILAGLGRMYVADERFRNNIDTHAEGTAAYAGEAILRYCKK